MVRILTIILFLFTHLFSFAQKEGNSWYFGEYAAIDFNGATPTAINNSSLNTFEGCSSISDNNGAILFYTNGIKVFNKNNTLMPNGTGLMGDYSSTQSALIVRKPGSSSIYYIFTTDNEGFSDGFRYSEVDMNLDGGLGDVTSNKNIPLLTPTCEKITAIRHQNKTDYWIVTHEFNSDAFYSYLLTSAGLNMTPIITNVGTFVSNSDLDFSIGYMKANIEGTQLAVAHGGLNKLELFNFDNSTGILSNPITFPTFSNIIYGVEFSPDGNILYATEVSFTSGYIYQYDLLAGSPIDIFNSEQVIFNAGGNLGALQLGPDKRIYFSIYGLSQLCAITYPNKLGLACNADWVLNNISLGIGNCQIGLPNLPNDFTNYTEIASTNLCFGDSNSFSFSSTTSVDSVIWNFGDPNSGINNTSTNLSPIHLFSDSGSFMVQLVFYFNNNVDTITDSVYVKPSPIIELGNDTTLCQGEILTLDASSYPNHLWQGVDSSITYNITQAGTYWVEVTNENSCSTRDTINVDFNPNPVINLGNDTLLCLGEILSLDVTSLNASYLWQDNSINATFIVSQPGLYWNQLTVDNCSASDTIMVDYKPLLSNIYLGDDATICTDEFLTLDASGQNTSYLWSDFSTNSSLTVSLPGTYWVTISDQCEIKSDTINIVEENCDVILELPNVFSPNNDGINDLFVPVNINRIKSLNTQIYNKWGQLIFTSDFITIGWDGRTTTGKLVPDGTYYWIVNYVDINNKSSSKKGFVTLLR